MKQVTVEFMLPSLNESFMYWKRSFKPLAKRELLYRSSKSSLKLTLKESNSSSSIKFISLSIIVKLIVQLAVSLL